MCLRPQNGYSWFSTWTKMKRFHFWSIISSSIHMFRVELERSEIVLKMWWKCTCRNETIRKRSVNALYELWCFVERTATVHGMIIQRNTWTDRYPAGIWTTADRQYFKIYRMRCVLYTCRLLANFKLQTDVGLRDRNDALLSGSWCLRTGAIAMMPYSVGRDVFALARSQWCPTQWVVMSSHWVLVCSDQFVVKTFCLYLYLLYQLTCNLLLIL